MASENKGAVALTRVDDANAQDNKDGLGEDDPAEGDADLQNITGWLNEKLDQEENYSPRDFTSGRLLGKLLNKLGYECKVVGTDGGGDAKAEVNAEVEAEAKRHAAQNFDNVTATLANMRVKLTIGDANDIMQGIPGAAASIVMRIKSRTGTRCGSLFSLIGGLFTIFACAGSFVVMFALCLNLYLEIFVNSSVLSCNSARRLFVATCTSIPVCLGCAAWIWATAESIFRIVWERKLIFTRCRFGLKDEDRNSAQGFGFNELGIFWSFVFALCCVIAGPVADKDKVLQHIYDTTSSVVVLVGVIYVFFANFDFLFEFFDFVDGNKKRKSETVREKLDGCCPRLNDRCNEGVKMAIKGILFYPLIGTIWLIVCGWARVFTWIKALVCGLPREPAPAPPALPVIRCSEWEWKHGCLFLAFVAFFVTPIAALFVWGLCGLDKLFFTLMFIWLFVTPPALIRTDWWNKLEKPAWVFWVSFVVLLAYMILGVALPATNLFVIGVCLLLCIVPALMRPSLPLSHGTVIVYLIVIAVVSFFGPNFQVDDSIPLNALPGASNGTANGTASRFAGRASLGSSAEEYSICGKDFSGLNMLDMGFLASLAYKMPEMGGSSNIFWQNQVSSYFNNSAQGFNWSVELIRETNPFFLHVRDSAKQISVVSIRGTNTSIDWFEDVDVWSEIGTLQLASLFFPLSIWWTPGMLSSYVDWTSRLFADDLSYVDTVASYVRDNTDSSDQVYLTGHSLGGGMAAIVGAKENKKSVGFSSPGALLQHKKFGFSRDALSQTATTVYLYGDVVPYADQHGGLVQPLQCRYELVKCHMLEALLCELWRGCPGLSSGGYWEKFCSDAGED